MNESLLLELEYLRVVFLKSLILFDVAVEVDSVFQT